MNTRNRLGLVELHMQKLRVVKRASTATDQRIILSRVVWHLSKIHQCLEIRAVLRDMKQRKQVKLFRQTFAECTRVGEVIAFGDAAKGFQIRLLLHIVFRCGQNKRHHVPLV
jgi:hypothetical protein